MAIITVSRGCFSHGKEIAERVAARLGYECISKEVLVEASYFFNIPEAKLSRSIHEVSGLLDRFTHRPQHFMDCVQAALLEHVKRDNVVYHGHAGHFFLEGVAHVLKVRVIAEMEDRLALLRKQEEISLERAVRMIEEEDRQREEWVQRIYKKDLSDPALYDMVVHIGRLNIEDACDLICATATRESFRTLTESQTALSDLALGTHVKTALADICEVEVSVNKGAVRIKVRGQKLRNTDYTRPAMKQRVQARIREDLEREITTIIAKISGVTDLVLDIEEPHYS